MEALSHKSLERVVSQKAMQMGSSFPCQFCVLGFLAGVCLTSFFLASFHFAPLPFSFSSVSSLNSSSTPPLLSKSFLIFLHSPSCQHTLLLLFLFYSTQHHTKVGIQLIIWSILSFFWKLSEKKKKHSLRFYHKKKKKHSLRFCSNSHEGNLMTIIWVVYFKRL